MADGQKRTRKEHRALFDETTKAINHGEKFEAALTKVLTANAGHKPTTALLDSTRKGLAALRQEAEHLEKLGWPERGEDGAKD